MAIRLIDKAERYLKVIDGSTFFYRRLPADIKARLIRRHTKRGVVDYEAVAVDGVKYGLLGWKDVFGTAGDGSAVPVVFEGSLVDSLPGDTISELAEDIVQGALGDSEADADPLAGSGSTSEPS